MMRALTAIVFVTGLLAATAATAADPPKVQGLFQRDGKTYPLTHAVAWQSARPDVLVLILSNQDVALMDVRHLFRMKQIAEEGKVQGLRFEFDPAHIDLHYVYGKYVLPGWNTFSGNMNALWDKLEIANGRIAGKLGSGGVQVEFDVPVTGGADLKTLTGKEAQHSPQAEQFLAYEDAVRKGSWKEASKYLTPISAEVLKKEVATPEGLGQFQTAGKYMKELLKQGDARRAEIEKVIVSGDDAAVIGPGFAADFVLVGGRWLKI